MTQPAPVPQQLGGYTPSQARITEGPTKPTIPSATSNIDPNAYYPSPDRYGSPPSSSQSPNQTLIAKHNDPRITDLSLESMRNAIASEYQPSNPSIKPTQRPTIPITPSSGPNSKSPSYRAK